MSLARQAARTSHDINPPAAPRRQPHRLHSKGLKRARVAYTCFSSPSLSRLPPPVPDTPCVSRRRVLCPLFVLSSAHACGCLRSTSLDLSRRNSLTHSYAPSATRCHTPRPLGQDEKRSLVRTAANNILNRGRVGQRSSADGCYRSAGTAHSTVQPRLLTASPHTPSSRRACDPWPPRALSLRRSPRPHIIRLTARILLAVLSALPDSTG